MPTKILQCTDNLPDEFCKLVTRKLRTTRVNVNCIEEIWAADLIDMQAFSKVIIGIKYLLTLIDIFSKCVCIVALKLKTGQKVANAFSRILKEQRSSKTWVDNGQEL